MPAVSIGIVPSKIYSATTGFNVDFIVQNLSGNNLYLIEEISQALADGIKIIPNDYISKDNWDKDIILVADGVTSDTRYLIQVKKKE